MKRLLVFGTLTFWLVAPLAHAQGTSPAPLSKVIVSDDVAKRTLMKTQINAATARALVDACVEFANTTSSSTRVKPASPEASPGHHSRRALIPSPSPADPPDIRCSHHTQKG